MLLLIFRKTFDRDWHALCWFIWRDHIWLWLVLTLFVLMTYVRLTSKYYLYINCIIHSLRMAHIWLIYYMRFISSVTDWHFFADILLITYTCLEYTTCTYLILCWLPLDTHCTNDVLMTYNWYNLCLWCTHDVYWHMFRKTHTWHA